MKIEILKSTEVTKIDQNQIFKLYKQLNYNNKQRSLQQVLSSENKVIMAVCREHDTIVGIALLASYIVISGHRGLVEDVVVTSSHRGKGIGRKILEKLLEEAKKNDLDEILLFTGHHRLPAIALYKSLGFTLRESGLYNLKF